MKILVFLNVFCLVVLGLGCGTTYDTANSNTRKPPIKQLQIGRNYDFILTLKEQKQKGSRIAPTVIEENIIITGKLVEVDTENGWLKIQKADTFDYVHFSDIERFTDITDKTPYPVKANLMDSNFSNNSFESASQQKAISDNSNKESKVSKPLPKPKYTIDNDALNAVTEALKKSNTNQR